MQHPYTLEWYDLLVNITLNPARTDVSCLTGAQMESIIKTAGEEKDKWLLLLKREVHALPNRAQIQLLIRRYHSDLVVLLDQAYENQAGMPQQLKMLSKVILEYLEELLFFIEGRYLKFLGQDQWVPLTYLHVTRQDLVVRLGKLKTQLGRRISDKTLTEIVFGTLYRFTSQQADRHVTFRQVVYMKELVRGLEEIVHLKTEKQLYKALNELLIYRNFNKKAYLNYFTEKIAGRINSFGAVEDKRDELLFSFKEFNQMHIKPGVRLNQHYKGIRSVVGNWFSQEINYLQNKSQWDVTPLENRPMPAKGKTEPSKIRLGLNADQIAILLRALADAGVLIVKHLSNVFKIVIPLLSSTARDELSWQSARKKGYAAEDKDKQAVIGVLKKMIGIIEGYT